MKYYQQSLATLANTMTQVEKQSMEIAFKKFIQGNQKINQKLLSCLKADEEWILDYRLVRGQSPTK